MVTGTFQVGLGMVKGSPVGPGLKGFEPPVELFDLLLEAVGVTDNDRETERHRHRQTRQICTGKDL